MISSSRLAELQHVPPAWKFCAVQSQERFDRENAQRADRPEPRRSGSAPRLPSRGCAGTAGCPAASATPGRCPPAWLRQWGPRPAANTWPASLSQKVGEQSRFRNSRERQRIEEKAFRARAGAAQSARQGGTEPGTTRFRDGRRTTGPPAPRRDPDAPTAQPRPRGPDLESAQI